MVGRVIVFGLWLWWICAAISALGVHNGRLAIGMTIVGILTTYKTVKFLKTETPGQFDGQMITEEREERTIVCLCHRYKGSTKWIHSEFDADWLTENEDAVESWGEFAEARIKGTCQNDAVAIILIEQLKMNLLQHERKWFRHEFSHCISDSEVCPVVG